MIYHDGLESTSTVSCGEDVRNRTPCRKVILKARGDPRPIRSVFLEEAIAWMEKQPHAVLQVHIDRPARPEIGPPFCTRCCDYQLTDLGQAAAGAETKMPIDLADLVGPLAACHLSMFRK